MDSAEWTVKIHHCCEKCAPHLAFSCALCWFSVDRFIGHHVRKLLFKGHLHNKTGGKEWLFSIDKRVSQAEQMGKTRISLMLSLRSRKQWAELTALMSFLPFLWDAWLNGQWSRRNCCAFLPLGAVMWATAFHTTRLFGLALPPSHIYEEGLTFLFSSGYSRVLNVL